LNSTRERGLCSKVKVKVEVEKARSSKAEARRKTIEVNLWINR